MIIIKITLPELGKALGASALDVKQVGPRNTDGLVIVAQPVCGAHEAKYEILAGCGKPVALIVLQHQPPGGNGSRSFLYVANFSNGDKLSATVDGQGSLTMKKTKGLQEEAHGLSLPFGGRDAFRPLLAALWTGDEPPPSSAQQILGGPREAAVWSAYHCTL